MAGTLVRASLGVGVAYSRGGQGVVGQLLSCCLSEMCP